MSIIVRSLRRVLPLVRRLSYAFFVRILPVILCALFFCEYAIYPVVIYCGCSWPAADKESSSSSSVIKAMFVADTHLLGPYRGHWFDKLRREWQMRRSFQSAVGTFDPEVVFFLGDLFDEGEWVPPDYFDTYVERFEELFYVPSHIRVLVVPGNHDTGFHYQTTRYKVSRFQTAFNLTTPVSLVRIKDVNFVLLNSMAMEMDGCFLCREGVTALSKVEDQLRCQKSSKCSPNVPFSPPLLLQHFPLYRPSDAACTGPDTDPKKNTKFRIGLDCLSSESSRAILHSIKPRAILSGHTHHHCIMNHSANGGVIEEYSIPSFSWRNRNDPSFYLAHISPASYHLSKCFLPHETTVIAIYAMVLLTLIFMMIKRPLFCTLLRLSNTILKVKAR